MMSRESKRGSVSSGPISRSSSSQGSSQQPAQGGLRSGKMAKGTLTSFWGSAIFLVIATGLFVFIIKDRKQDGTVDSGVSESSEKLPDGDLGNTTGLVPKQMAEGLAESKTDNPGNTSGDAMRTGRTVASGEKIQSLSPGEGQDAALNDRDENDIYKALEALDQGNLAEASQLLDGVLQRDPNNERALVEMAMMQLLDLKQPEQAAKYLQRAFDVNPSNPMVMNELVSLFEEQGKVDEGVQFFADQMNRRAQTPAARDVAYGAGQMMMVAGRDHEALGFLQKAVEGGAGNVRAYVDLAETYSRLGDHEKSIESYQKSITAQQKEMADQQARGFPMQYGAERIGFTKMQLVREYLKAGQKEKAQSLMEEVKQLLPGDDSVTALQKQVTESLSSAKG